MQVELWISSRWKYYSSRSSKLKQKNILHNWIAKLLVTLTTKVAVAGSIPVTGKYLYDVEYFQKSSAKLT